MSGKMKSKNYSSEERTSATAQYLEGVEAVSSISANTGISEILCMRGSRRNGIRQVP